MNVPVRTSLRARIVPAVLAFALLGGATLAQLTPGVQPDGAATEPGQRSLVSPAPGWAATFGGAETRAASALALTDDGGLFATGWSTQPGVGNWNVWVARLDASGAALWQRELDGGGWDEGWDVLATSDGGCLVVGNSRSFGAGDWDGWVVKLSGEGAVEWEKVYGGSSDDELTAVALSPDGYYLGGTTETLTTGKDVWLLEIDALGDVLWQQRVAGEEDDWLGSLAATPDGLVFVSSSKSNFTLEIPGIPFFRPWVGKLDGDGNALWERTYNYSGGDAWSRIEVLPDGGFVVAGEIIAMGFNRGDVWVVRLDADGAVVWDRRYGDNFLYWFDGATDVEPLPGGGFAVLATTATAGAGSDDLWLLLLDAQGDLVHDTTYGAASFDASNDLEVAGDGGLFLSGFLGAEAFVARREPGGTTGAACDLSSPTAPNAWTDGLTVAAVSALFTPTTVVPVDTRAAVAPIDTGTFLCPPN